MKLASQVKVAVDGILAEMLHFCVISVVSATYTKGLFLNVTYQNSHGGE